MGDHRRPHDENAPGQSREALILKAYLAQYFRAVKKRDQLEKRLKNICREMESPIGGKGYKPVNFNSSETSSGSASFTLRKSEIESRIKEQKRTIEEDLLKVMDIFDYLDQDSDKRMILELRYIDRLSWRDVSRTASISRSRCFDYWNAGIDMLLEFKRVQKIIADFAEKTGC